MISQDGIIDVAEFCRSPNFDERPHNAGIDLIVIHAISLPPGHFRTQLIKDLFFLFFILKYSRFSSINNSLRDYAST